MPSDAVLHDRPIAAILDILDERVVQGQLDARALLQALGRSALLPAMILPAMLMVSPLSAIPLFSSCCAVVIIFVALQGVVGRTQPWLPGWLLDRRLPQERTKNAVSVMRRLTGWLDRLSRERLSLPVRRPLNRVLYLICAVAAACVPFLELVPMSSTTIGAGVLLVSVGMLTRDGVIALLGLAALGLASLLPWFVVTQVAALAG